MFKYQTGFANDLAAKCEAGNHSEVRNVIRNLKNKAQAAYITACVALLVGEEEGYKFLEYMHPNNRPTALGTASKTARSHANTEQGGSPHDHISPHVRPVAVN